jgi:hypothetical protein
MGGYGSGPYGNIGSKTRKMTTSQCYGIDSRRWKRDDLLFVGNSFGWTWTKKDGHTASISVSVPTNGEIVLSYTVTIDKVKTPVSTIVNLGYTRCNYGGSRVWFGCPGCNKLVAWLYLRGTKFRCRRCHNLTYYSCQESGNLNDMSIRRVNRVLSRLKSKEKCGFDILYYAPLRPRYMHFKTYQRLRQRYTQKQNEYAASIRAKVESFGCHARELIDLPDGF